MPYCVHCGVELDAGVKDCPLCGTEVHDPAADPAAEHPPFFPARRAEVAPVSKRTAALLLTSMLASVSLCCALLNLALKPEHRWYLFVVGAAAMLWVWLVLPLLVNRWVPLWVRLTADVGAVAGYVAVAAAVVCALSWLLRRGHSMLTTAMLCLGAAGLLCVGIEACVDLYFHGLWSPGWSLVVLAACVGFSIPLAVVRRVPSLREEARRRFHF